MKIGGQKKAHVLNLHGSSTIISLGDQNECNHGGSDFSGVWLGYHSTVVHNYLGADVHKIIIKSVSDGRLEFSLFLVGDDGSIKESTFNYNGGYTIEWCNCDDEIVSC